jgi:hypothetical protein
MDEQTYSFQEPQANYIYRFQSSSSEKEVTKLVKFTLTDTENVYNLALLDLLPDGQTSDITETKNKDMVTVLATVMKIVIDFLDKFPTVAILFSGSDQRRQRLYRILIGREFQAIRKKFNVFGSIGNEIEFFEPNQDYDFFIITKHEY